MGADSFGTLQHSKVSEHLAEGMANLVLSFATHSLTGHD